MTSPLISMTLANAASHDDPISATVCACAEESSEI
jgi:hypothetical protein